MEEQFNMQVAIHAGAFFTDEGELIKLLKANTQALRQNEAAIWAFRAYKHTFRPALGPVGDRPPPETTLQNFRNLMPAGRTVNRAILCSETYIGERPTALMDGQFYPQAGSRLALLDQIFSDSQVEIFIGLRNPASYIPRVLMALSAPERERVIRSTDLSCLSWLTTIEDMRDLAPDVQITLWSNEDSPLIRGDVARALIGLQDDVPLNTEYDLLASLVSDAGQREIEQLTQQNLPPNDPELKAGLALIFQEYALPDAIEEEVELPGWDQDIVAAFTELYEQDVARLQSMPEIRFIKP